jgi:CubicO group peptidase (beta-lactamase class C family)
MQLVKTGKVDLDAPVQRYLPWFRVADADASARITVRHLLNQTSGFPTFQANAGMIGGDMDEQALERTVRSFASMSLSQPVGSTYQYSNFNYMTLGMLVQVVSGESYEQYLQQHVLEPLDMHRSFTSQAAAQGHGLATGYRFWFGIPVAADLTYLCVHLVVLGPGCPEHAPGAQSAYSRGPLDAARWPWATRGSHWGRHPRIRPDGRGQVARSTAALAGEPDLVCRRSTGLGRSGWCPGPAQRAVGWRGSARPAEQRLCRDKPESKQSS